MREKVKEEVMRYFAKISSEKLQITVSNTKYFETLFDVAFIDEYEKETFATFSLASGLITMKSDYCSFKVFDVIRYTNELIEELNKWEDK